MKRAFILFAALIFVASCRDEIVDPPPPSDGATSDSSATFTLALVNMRRLRPSEQYGLWIEYQSSFRRVSSLTIFGTPTGDTTFLYGRMNLPVWFDSVDRVIVAIENEHSELKAKLVGGAVEKVSVRNWSIPLAPMLAFSDFVEVTGEVTFATTLADTNESKKELYLMNFVDGKPVASIQQLPLPTDEWEYALWAIDSGFFPYHLFYYGSFQSATGNDSENQGDSFQFPGGNNGVRLNTAGTEILVTVEPRFMRDKLKAEGPSAINFLSARSNQFIYDRARLEMTNTSATGIPQGRIEFRR